MKYFLIIILLLSKSIFAQTTIQYYPWQSLLGITQQIAKPIAIDYKLETNSFFNNMNMELGFRFTHQRIYQTKEDDKIQLIKKIHLYAGFGLAFNPLNAIGNLNTINGYYADLGFRWHPPKADFLFLSFEASPYINRNLTNGNLRTRLGIGYRLGRK